MLGLFNSPWIILICIIILYAIFKKIWNLNKPFDEQKFIMQHMNQEKLKKNFTLESFHKHLPDIASYYVGL